MLHKNIRAGFVAALATAVLLLQPLGASAASNYFRSVYFRLYRYNGPIYIDVNGYCPGGMGVNARLGDLYYYWEPRHKYIDGNQRFWPTNLVPNTTYDVTIGCRTTIYQESPQSNRQYRLRYSGSSIQVSLVRAWTQ